MRNRIIFARRIWPAPRWPLIHEAKKAYLAGGKEGLLAWADSLSDEEKIAVARQFVDLIQAGAEKVLRDMEEKK